MNLLRNPLAPLLALLLLSPAAHAELRVSNAFGDHMVLQQEMPIRVWGWATPGQKIVVKLSSDADGAAGVVGDAVAGKDGKWLATLAPLKADGHARTLRIKGDGGAVAFKDVLLGEVWICSGQSNMEWSLRQSANPQEEIANAKHPTIRLFNVPGHVKQNTPQDDARGSWRVCTPQSAADFTAVGYHFGRALSRELGVPIGLIGTNWGGTRIEPWTPPVGFEKVPQLANYSEAIKAMDPATPEGNAARKAYVERVEAWLVNAKAHANTGKETGSAPQFNIDPPGGATQIYNGMVAGLTPMSVRGAIWYQGESNAGNGLAYDYMKEALVKGWREVFDNDELSFYWVQLANFRNRDDNPAGGGWGPVREGQRRALRLPHTGMAVIIDIGAANDIHPKNKQDVGKRLALWALAKDYAKDIVYSGPLYKSHAIEGNQIRVTFDHTGGGLMVADKAGAHFMGPVKPIKDGELKEFAIQDAEGNWHWAKAKIDGKSVVVWHDGVKQPKAVRYAYQSNPDQANLYNKEGLPASPFTTVD
ncbi:MAG: sialate O-acetylesterase [Phycisphaeraceae bacterium]